MGREKLHEQPSGRLIESLKMERVRTILTHGYPYRHEHSTHFIIRKTIKPNYSNFSRWYVAWIFLAALYHLPSFQSMGLDLMMNHSLLLAIYVSSLVFFIIFRVIFLGLWYLGLVSRIAEKQQVMLTIIQNCAVISTACCVFYSHCGSRTLSRDKSIDRRTANWVAFSLWRKQNEDNTLISKLLRMHKFNDQICPSWFAPVRSASDYPPSVRACISLLFIYCSIFILVCLLQLASNGSEHSNIISPVYSFWAIFIGLCMANYVVEWSTGWALTHPLPISEYENLKKLLKPDFEDTVRQYSATSTDLLKTVFNLMISVTLFVGRFDMRMMQAAMNKGPDESKSGDLLYDHLDGKDELSFDIIADAGDCGNSTYAIAPLLAQRSLVVKSDDSRLIFPGGELLLIGGNLISKSMLIYI
ncbi:uncharacterized protein LOC119270319 isoform X2 [Triticum dicoccoides]|uniref:uncharacterized protein LOC119270319 isoform X2 n=1 Tax=Triticum dicoccoides TaxID=85692 RepID=UPI000E7CC9FA|nr:uncharacterized protein LOC119270319 isoform X2 [Triticum dicoccoides]